MDHKGILSSAFNMSLGFIPVIISILLCELITQDTAIYIGTGIGIIGIYLSYRRKGLLIPNFILYIATGVLALLSVAGGCNLLSVIDKELYRLSVHDETKL